MVYDGLDAKCSSCTRVLDGEAIGCDACGRIFHFECIDGSNANLPFWYCGACELTFSTLR